MSGGALFHTSRTTAAEQQNAGNSCAATYLPQFNYVFTLQEPKVKD